jgi:hypothetical protein
MPRTLGLIAVPALLALALLWPLFFLWLRYRSWLRHRHQEVRPVTEHFSLIGGLGALLFGLAAIAVEVFTSW